MNDITIIMGAYNCEETISDAIDSLLQQTSKNWMLVVCEDCSSDSTLDILKKYESIYDQIQVIQNHTNLGLAASLNNCLKHVKSKYVARMDADDLCHPERLFRQFSFLEENPKFSIVSSAMELFDINGPYGIVHVVPEPSKYDFVHGTPHCHAPMMMKTDALFDVNGYNANLRRAQDYDLWSRLYEKGHVGFNLSEPLYSMRDDVNAVSRRGYRTRVSEVKLRYNIFKRLNLPILCYIYCFKPLIPILVPGFVYKYIRSRRYKLNS